MRPHRKKVNTKGVPNKDKHITGSTKQSPSLWEHVDSRDPKTQALHTKATWSARKFSRKSNISHNPPKSILVKVNITHKEQMSSFMHGYIKKVADVAKDGYCGFHAVVGQGDVDDYQMNYS